MSTPLPQADLSNWPDVRASIEVLAGRLPIVLGYLDTMYCEPQDQAAHTLQSLHSTADGVIKEIDVEVSHVRPRVKATLAAVEARTSAVNQRKSRLEAGKRELDRPESPAVGPQAAIATALVIMITLAVVGGLLDLDVTQHVALVVTPAAAGIAAATGANALGLTSRSQLLGVAGLAIVFTGLITWLVDERTRATAAEAAALIGIAVIAVLPIFGVVLGVYRTREERQRRRQLMDATNGIVAADHELQHVLPDVSKSMVAALEWLDELQHNFALTVRAKFAKASDDVVTARNGGKKLADEREALLAAMDAAIEGHLDSPRRISVKAYQRTGSEA
jgi:hypothetical protein